MIDDWVPPSSLAEIRMMLAPVITWARRPRTSCVRMASNIPSTVPFHASQMFARNVFNFVTNLLDKENNLNLDPEDEIIKETWMTKDGEVILPRIQELLKGDA